MKGKGHRDCTTLALDMLGEMDGFDLSFAEHDKTIVTSSIAVDTMHDVELVHVKGLGPHGRDNPHDKEWYIPQWYHDKATYTIDRKEKYPFVFWTTLNHYLDLRKGPGEFDDYDGYSYFRGSGKEDQNQRIVGSSGVDHLTAIYLRNRYVHAPGHPHYQDCSPALERYSFHQDLGRYGSAIDEIQARFPLARWYPAPGHGFPFSVFFPIDNVARYWFGHYRETREAESVGNTLHAIQDCSVPHHAAATIGNYHSGYEKHLNGRLDEFRPDADWRDRIIGLFHEYRGHDDSPPTSLAIEDHSKVPCMNWRIDMIGTWLALNAFKEYNETYDRFKGEFEVDDDSLKELTAKAVALSMVTMLMLDAEDARAGPD